MELVKIEWYDACSRKIDKDVKAIIDDTIGHISGKEFLAQNTTYGKVYKVLPKVLIILTEKSTGDDEDDCIFIPRGWIISPKKYKIKEEQI